MKETESENMGRRSFFKKSMLIGAAGIAASSTSVFSSCSEKKNDSEENNVEVPDLADEAIPGKELKAGVIGCGSRGSGAAFDFLNAGSGLTITAIGDVFQDKVDALADRLWNEKKISISEENRFVGIDAYKNVIDSGVDVVIIVAPPFYRPIHFKYATEKGKHSFLEKPICVDPVGYRSMLVTAKQADVKNLCVVTGTQYRFQRSFIESYKKIREGLIGEITGGNLYYNQGMLWYRNRQADWGDGEWMLRDWVNWKWLSGDHIVEQHIHNLDNFVWFSGLRPESAVGFGSRQKRITGDQYDNFSVDFTMENGIHVHSMCRQIDGCSNNVSDFIQGTKGSFSNYEREFVFKDLKGNVIWQYDKEAEERNYKQTSPYVLEHVAWINHIRRNEPINMVSQTLISNMMGIMGRESAYTGRKITWDEMMVSPLDYTLDDFDLKKMDMDQFIVPIPGK